MRCYIVLALLATTQLLLTEGVNIGENCPADKACPTNAACQTASTTPCLCNDGYTAKSDKTGCLAKVGTACSGTATSNNCILNAGCTGDAQLCTCNNGYIVNTDKTVCNSAVAGVASLALVLAAFVTSRFL